MAGKKCFIVLSQLGDPVISACMLGDDDWQGFFGAMPRKCQFETIKSGRRYGERLIALYWQNAPSCQYRFSLDFALMRQTERNRLAVRDMIRLRAGGCPHCHGKG